jgi:hypothetical protein
MKLMTALLALRYCATVFAMGAIKDGQGVGFGDTRANAFDAAQRRLFRKGRPKPDFSSARGSTKEAAKSMTVTVKDRVLAVSTTNAWLSGKLPGEPQTDPSGK